MLRGTGQVGGRDGLAALVGNQECGVPGAAGSSRLGQVASGGTSQRIDGALFPGAGVAAGAWLFNAAGELVQQVLP
ncbi:hypothetical protein [Streptomyces chartreusis]